MIDREQFLGFFGLVPSETAVLQSLQSRFNKTCRDRLVKKVDRVATLSAARRELLWDPLDQIKFNPCIFEDEHLVDLMSDAIAPRASHDPDVVLLQLYSGVLILHSYVSGYHWNAANQEDEHIILGWTAAIGCSLPNADEIRMSMISFFRWIVDECGKLDRKGTLPPHYDLPRITPPFYGVASLALLLATSEQAIARSIQLVGEFHKLIPSDANKNSNSEWLIRLDFCAERADLSRPWKRIRTIIMNSSANIYDSAQRIGNI